MSGYNLDESRGLFDFFNSIQVSKVLYIGQRISIKHYSLFEVSSAFVIEVTNHSIKIKFKSSLPELDFLPDDPIVIDFNDQDKVFFLSGEILNVESLDPLILDIKIKKIERVEAFRRSERFPVSLASSIETNDGRTAFAIVKNISLLGIKINCKEALSLGESIKISVVLDKYYTIECTGKIVRKSKMSHSFEYGLEISGISPTSSTTYENFIDQIKATY